MNRIILAALALSLAAALAPQSQAYDLRLLAVPYFPYREEPIVEEILTTLPHPEKKYCLTDSEGRDGRGPVQIPHPGDYYVWYGDEELYVANPDVVSMSRIAPCMRVCPSPLFRLCPFPLEDTPAPMEIIGGSKSADELGEDQP
jgi:hypothetical protein